MNKYLNHLKKVVVHKWYVGVACFQAGLYWQGITHDLSKLSLEEFIPYALHYDDSRSPVDVMREEYGYCEAWQHHKGHNPHHWEYWLDFDNGEVTPLKMPYKYATELICDWIGAGKVYNKANWSDSEPYNYWKVRNHKFIMHADTYRYIETMTYSIKMRGIKETLKISKDIYSFASVEYDELHEALKNN